MPRVTNRVCVPCCKKGAGPHYSQQAAPSHVEKGREKFSEGWPPPARRPLASLQPCREESPPPPTRSTKPSSSFSSASAGLAKPPNCHFPSPPTYHARKEEGGGGGGKFMRPSPPPPPPPSVAARGFPIISGRGRRADRGRPS